MKKRRRWIFVVLLGLLLLGIISYEVFLAQGARRQDVSSVPQSWQDGGIFSSADERAYNKLLTMSPEEKIGQLILARHPKQGALNAIAVYHLGGYVLFGQEFQNRSADQVQKMLAEEQNAADIPLILAVDEEGGTVVRVSNNPQLADQKFLSPQELYAQGGLAAVRADTINKAKLLKSLGLNLNLAPVADVSVNPADYIYKRTLGKPASETADYVTAVVEEMHKEGLSSTLKHFPGYGNNVDTHKGMAVDRRPYSTFTEQDFIPFQAGIEAGTESILVSHNIVECMEENTPASLAPAVHELLRDKLHFTGVIISDDLSMEAIKDYTGGNDPAVQAILAGNDLLIMTDFVTGYQAVLSAVQAGKINQDQIDRSVFRILAWKYARNIE